MYKILEDKREPNLRTVRQVIKSLKIIMEPEESHFIAVVASNMVVENLPKTIDLDGLTVSIREYPVSTVEDAIIAAVRAERDGAHHREDPGYPGVPCDPVRQHPEGHRQAQGPHLNPVHMCPRAPRRPEGIKFKF